MGSNTGSPTHRASGIVPPAGAESPMPRLVPGRFWFCRQVLAVGGGRAAGPPWSHLLQMVKAIRAALMRMEP